MSRIGKQINSLPKQVTFHIDVVVAVHEAPVPEGVNGNDVSDNGPLYFFNPEDVWYSKIELEMIATKCRELVFAAEASASCPEETLKFLKDDTMRGLESQQSREGGRATLRARREAKEVVFDEQDMQKLLDINYPEAIASEYALQCQRSVDVAIQRGRDDAKQIVQDESIDGSQKQDNEKDESTRTKNDVYSATSTGRIRRLQFQQHKNKESSRGQRHEQQQRNKRRKLRSVSNVVGNVSYVSAVV